MVEWTNVIMGVITLLGGCGWVIDRRKHKVEMRKLERWYGSRSLCPTGEPYFLFGPLRGYNNNLYHWKHRGEPCGRAG